MLYWAYWVLLVLHCPDFWLWLVIPGTVFVFFKIYRFLRTLIGSGKTSIQAGILLPGKVTNLIIQRPSKFAYSPGDWIFVKIPEISWSEWHPFTISSAPEQKVYHHKTYTMINFTSYKLSKCHDIFKALKIFFLIFIFTICNDYDTRQMTLQNNSNAITLLIISL